MDENYLDNLYNELKSNPKFDFRLDQETFNDRMLNDTNYRDKVYTNVKMFSSNNEFKVDPNTFYTRVLESSKKKSQSEIGSQTTQPGSGSENAQYAFEPGMQEQPTFQGVGKAVEKNLGVKTQSDQDIQAPLTEEGVKELEYRKRIEADKDKYKLASDEQIDEAIRRNPEIASSDKFYEGAVPEIEGIPTTLFGSKTKLEAAQKERDYLQNWDEDFEAAPKQTDLFSDDDIKSDPKKYQEAALNDYLEYLKSKNGEDSQTYLGTKEKIDYYKSLGDKLYTDGEYADDLRRFQDIQKTALSKIGNNSYAKALKIQNSYDWDYFSKRASDLELKAQTIQKQINELGVSEGKVLSAPQQKKYEDLLNQYNNIQTEFSKLSEDTRIDDNVISEMNNIQKTMSKVQDNLSKIEDEDTPNAKRVKEYKEELEANKKAQEEFYNTKDSGVLETTGKAISMIGQKTASSFVSGVFSMFDLAKISGEAMGAKGYGWTDKMSEAADNINSYVDLYSPQLESGNLTNFMSSMSSLGEGLGSVLTFYTGGSSVSGLAKGLNLSQKSLNIANKAGQFAVASSLSTSQMYDEFLNNGFTPEQASRYALGAGIVMGAAEMIVPEDELLANQLKGSFLSAVKSGATTKEAIENGLQFLASKSFQIAETARKEGTEELVGQLAESTSKQVSSTMTGNKIDGIWNVDDFTKSGLAGGGVGGIIELFKFGSKTGKYSNPFEENMVGYLAENYDDMIKKLSESNPEAYDQIADRYGKLKQVYNGLKNTPAFNQLSKADQDHVLAQAHTKQVILENIKQSGLDKATFSDQIASIDEDIFLTLNKPKENAIQERSNEEVLPREQGETTETGGEPQGMGQGVQGEEVAKEGKQEEVSVNREPIAEDIAPEQKAKIEEANTKDEDESVSEIYDFNDEIKSVGTKEQFKAFLRSLSPKGVFSRIAWHNSDKESLQPREGQYYTNTRRNAEETYKREFTHPAIIFGNAPQKMDFDQVQEFDINDVKSQGNDIVITDDLSPAIGAEMNYREFIPSSADQIIPIGTKENIEAFKSFVEQQKSATTPQVTPQAQEVTFEKLSDEDKKSIDSISNDLEEYLKNNPEQYFTGEKKDGKVNVKVKGGLLDIRAAALNSDKRKSVPTPTSLPFLPKIINLKHLARNKSDKKSILKNGFNENQVSLDSAIPGIYFSSDDWSTMGRFDRSTKDSLFASIENEGLIYFDSAKEFEDFLKENNLPVRARRLTKDQVDFLRSKGIKGILLREDYASGERNELIVIDKSIIKDISESEKEITDIPSSFVEPKSISKAYYLAKKNNSNPELVEAVEKAIGKKSINKNEEVKPTVEAQETEQEVAPEEEAKVVEEASKNEGIKPKNMQDLIGIYRKVFGLSFPKAVSAAMVSNRLIKQMAKRAGVTTEQMYQRLSFQKANEKDLPQGVKMQVDAWHGSPYEFDKFQTQFMGKGEGAQAFGWGLYFTDLKNIAVSYAKSLAKTTFKGQPISDNPIFEKLLISLDAENSDFYNYETGEIKNLNKFKEYIDDMYNYSKEQLDKGVDENHPLVSRMMSDYEYSQSKIDEVKANLEKLKNYDYKSLKQSLIDAGAYEEVANKLVDDFIKRRESEKKFLYEAMKYQASRASRLDKAINLIKNDLKSDANYYKYLKENFDKFNLSRNLYKVSLHEGKTPDQYTWLEWDKKPNKEQVSKLLSKLNQEQLDKSFYYGISPDETNGSFYKKLTRALGSDKAASIFLLENGIDGIKYPAESISRGVTSETARGFNYVVFDENTVSIKEVVKFQKDAEKARGAMMMGMDGQAIIYALTDANVSTPLHELAHVFEHYLTDAEKNQIIKAAKTKGWTTETSEYFARGFEKYLAEGKSSDPIFEKFKQFLLDIYKAIKGSPIDVKLNKQMKDIYAQMLGEDLTAELGEDIEEQETKLEEMEVSEANLVSEYEQIKNMSGIDKIDAMNKWKEKYGELANRYMYIENNYDKLAEQFKAIRTCEFE